MKNILYKKEKIMMFSNIFLILPVIFALIYQEWLYFLLAFGLFIFSPLFHWYKIKYYKSYKFNLFMTLDWVFAVVAFIYMYIYTYKNLIDFYRYIFITLLTLIILFFFYGWKRGDYEKWHPIFHVLAPIVSSLILIYAN